MQMEREIDFSKAELEFVTMDSYNVAFKRNLNRDTQLCVISYLQLVMRLICTRLWFYSWHK